MTESRIFPRRILTRKRRVAKAQISIPFNYRKKQMTAQRKRAITLMRADVCVSNKRDRQQHFRGRFKRAARRFSLSFPAPN